MISSSYDLTVSTQAAQSVPDEKREERPKSAPSGRLLLRMPRTLHADLAQAAEREGTSLNQFITSALTRTVTGEEGERAAAPAATERQSRVIAAALVANAVVIGLAAITAIAVLLVALLG
jgi:HicB family